MRISTYWQFRRMERATEQSVHQMTLWQQRVATGKRIEQPSDDPVGSVHALALREQIQQIDQYGRNIREARLFLQATEQAFADIGDILHRTRQIITQGANDTNDANAREALAQEIRELQRRLLQIGNQRPDGERYLFSGQTVHTAPIDVVGGVASYVGDGNPMLVQIAADRTLAMNFSGARIADLYNKLTQIENNLLSGASAQLSMVDLQDIEQFQNEFHRYRGEVGVRLRELTNYEQLHLNRRDQLTGNLADIEEIDLAEAISQLKQSELSYQASLQVFTRIQSVNLFDFLRGG
ncbi:MAG: flagellar hook-associated protein FlgL [Fimbriimonadales bacterium]|nr:MAG: flagellar hook-associated protein FlgL [Fimbriimonadales bacterium]